MSEAHLEREVNLGPMASLGQKDWQAHLDLTAPRVVLAPKATQESWDPQDYRVCQEREELLALLDQKEREEPMEAKAAREKLELMVQGVCLVLSDLKAQLGQVERRVSKDPEAPLETLDPEHQPVLPVSLDLLDPLDLLDLRALMVSQV